MTHFFVIILCCTGICCIPYFIKTFKDVEHKCGKCNTVLAKWTKLFNTTKIYITDKNF